MQLGSDQGLLSATHEGRGHMGFKAGAVPDRRSLGLCIMGSKMRMMGWLMWCSR